MVWEGGFGLTFDIFITIKRWSSIVGLPILVERRGGIWLLGFSPKLDQIGSFKKVCEVFHASHIFLIVIWGQKNDKNTDYSN